MIKNLIYTLISISLILATSTGIVFADDIDVKGSVHDLTLNANWAGALYDAKQNFMKGDYKNSIRIYNDYFVYFPNDVSIKAMKGIALNNLRLGSTLAAQPSENISFSSDPFYLNRLSILEFYEILKIEPHNIIALNGMGLGFGNYGEYEESKKYFKKTLDVKPDDKIAKNYLDYIEKIEKKYANIHAPAEKPKFLTELEKKEIPGWIKNNAGWWADVQIPDSDFIYGIEYLIQKNVITIKTVNINKNTSEHIPSWIKINAGWWAKNIISDQDFLSSIEYLIENGVIKLNYYNDSENLKRDQDRQRWNFQLYLDNITKKLNDQPIYIEHPNPSADVIKKFHRDALKWMAPSLDMQEKFPDREVSLIDDIYHIKYKVFVSPQPASLPLDHIGTLKNSFKYWEDRTFVASDDNEVIFHFEITKRSDLANIWVTWSVRNLGEGVLGHANIGKGVAEVALGSYGCDGSFQLFDVETVEEIMTHELGHSIGFGGHSDDPNDIMYSSMSPGFAYCLLDKSKI
jgi:tetratricopeptide (TPR) repeat protein